MTLAHEPNRFRFGKERLQKLPLPEAGKRATYYDTEVPKLAIRLTSSGARTYYVVRRAGREMVWFKLGFFPEMTVEQARNQAMKVLADFASAKDPAEARRAAKGIPTVGEFFLEYEERHGRMKKSWRDDLQRYRDYLDGPLRTKKLNAVTRDMVGRILSDMERAHKAGATVNNVRALASGIFAKAIEWGYLSESPVKGIKTRKTNKRDRFLRAHELPRFFASLEGEPNSNIRDYFALALLTGARRSNVLAMRWDELDFDDSIWRIPDTKNGTPQNAVLVPEAITILESRKASAASPFVFPGEGKSGHLVEPKAGWVRIFDRDELTQLTLCIQAAGIEFEVSAGEGLNAALARARDLAVANGLETEGCRIGDIRIHDLRRTLGSWQAKQGTSLAIIGKSLNHKSQQSTLIYARLDLDPIRTAVNAATSAMLDAAKGPVRAGHPSRSSRGT